MLYKIVVFCRELSYGPDWWPKQCPEFVNILKILGISNTGNLRTYCTYCTYVHTVHTVRSVLTVHTVHTAHTLHTVHTVRSVHTVPYRAVPYRTAEYKRHWTRFLRNQTPIKWAFRFAHWIISRSHVFVIYAYILCIHMCMYITVPGGDKP